mgnify:CR=1 FL=1
MIKSANNRTLSRRRGASRKAVRRRRVLLKPSVDAGLVLRGLAAVAMLACVGLPVRYSLVSRRCIANTSPLLTSRFITSSLPGNRV